MKKEILDDENKNFEKIKCVVKDIISTNEVKIDKIDEEISHIRQYMLDNIELDMEEGDIDIDALRNGEIIQDLHTNKNLLELKNYKLSQIQNSPFFGRFDIKDSFGSEKYYIGLQNVQKDNNIYVIDWRAPICSLYYDSELGKTRYVVDDKIFQTELILKRQFDIENSCIVNYYDVNNALNDAYLNKILQGKTSNYMSNIVKTIQEEQSDIIRLPLVTSVILQGVAGSGKTSIAMHRIAYLLYSNKELNHNNILFISPSALFTAYISHLLPELGEDNVLCYSLFEVLTEQKLLCYTPITRTQLLENVLNGDKQLQMQIDKIYSVAYFDSLCEYLTEQVTVKDFVNLFPNMSQKLIEKLFYVGDDGYNLRKRIKFISERFANYFGYKKIKTQMLTRKIFQYFDDKFNTDILFRKFMTSQELCVDKKLNQNVSTYIFIKMCIEGFNEDKEIRHIVIDEMQDYDFLSYKILTMLYPKATYTILGDMHQNLLTQSTNSLQKLQTIINGSELKKLEISYRSTSNIFAYANRILGEQSSAKIIRQGDNPEEIIYQDYKKLVDAIKKNMRIAKDNNQKVAILCQNINDAMTLSKFLPNIDLLLSDTTITALESSAILSTVYLCKGLEFDRVIIPIKKSEFQNPQNKQLLYVAITRALHNVSVCLYE